MFWVRNTDLTDIISVTLEALGEGEVAIKSEKPRKGPRAKRKEL